MPLNEGCDIAVLGSANQVAFPVARNGAIFDGRRPFADRYSILNLAITLALLAGVFGAPNSPSCAQMLQEFLFKDATCLYIKASLNRFV
ncbi:MAG: hypothetical protein ACJAXK_001635 [Yoonia sp.]|jgi:hypothetical protein